MEISYGRHTYSPMAFTVFLYGLGPAPVPQLSQLLQPAPLTRSLARSLGLPPLVRVGRHISVCIWGVYNTLLILGKLYAAPAREHMALSQRIKAQRS